MACRPRAQLRGLEFAHKIFYSTAAEADLLRAETTTPFGKESKRARKEHRAAARMGIRHHFAPRGKSFGIGRTRSNDRFSSRRDQSYRSNHFPGSEWVE